MRITIVQGAFLPVPPLKGGAVEKVWFALGKEFAARGHSVTHISRRFHGLPNDEVAEGVRHVRVPGFDAPGSMVRLKLLDLAYSIRAMRRLVDADVLVTNTFWLPILIRGSRKGKAYVHVARYPKGQMRFYGHVARLQTVSSSIASAIEMEVPGLADKIRVIPYPVEQASVSCNQNSENRKKEILYVGRIHPEKGLHLLVDAFAGLVRSGLENWRLIIVGPAEIDLGGGGLDYLAALKQRSVSLGDRVEWVGPVFESDRLAGYYRSASLFVYPSLAERGETFGLAPLEAMSYGCAPLVSDLACFRDHVSDQRTGFVFDHRTPDPTATLGNKLLELVNDANRLAEVGGAAGRSSADYRLSIIADRMLEDFASLETA